MVLQDLIHYFDTYFELRDVHHTRRRFDGKASLEEPVIPQASAVCSSEGKGIGEIDVHNRLLLQYRI